MPTSTEVRQQFLDFFCKKQGHTHIVSSSVVPHDDPTLLFANAGMNQFKPYFLGTEQPKHRRVANSQKCIRAGGKHNDLDDVGKDTYHHTFFEMLGNWSFGDYFKQEAITWAWELLTQVWGLDPSRLHVTVFEGDPANGIPKDDEAAEIWKSVGVLPGHIHLGNKKDNFWEMGDTGPCGPCTEIHYDSTPDKSGAKLVNQSSDQCIEIWNNVFIQFNRNPDQSLTPLPAKHVDTGMGFERITKVLQGKSSNYDTDVFTPIFQAIQSVTKCRDYTSKLDDHIDTAYRVIGDHIRTLTFALTDGARIGNVGREYVLRRVLRRAERYGRQYLGATEPFLHKLVPTLVEQMGGAFPELKANPEKVRELIYEEEESFLRTLDRGIQLFELDARSAIAERIEEKLNKPIKRYLHKGGGGTLSKGNYLKNSLKTLHYTFIDLMDGGETTIVQEVSQSVNDFIRLHTDSPPQISGEQAFKLHDTYGILIDITEQMATEAGLTVDKAGYEIEMEKARELARQGGKKYQVTAVSGELPKTDDSPKYSYELCEATVLGWVIGSDVIRTGTLAAGETAGLLLDRTNFYAEQGGQVGDTGVIDDPTTTGAEFQVEDTQRLGDAILHFGTVLGGSISVGTKVRCAQSTLRRIDIMRNHTATHLLNQALRQVLGQHVDQKGSLVDDEKTRFDFSHDKPISAEEIRAIEAKVNRFIVKDEPVSAVTMPLAEAKTLPGVRAVFGEKYPDPVRVVMIGAESPEEVQHEDSVEFCGGTHVPRTGTIGLFKIQSQEGVAKGIRRITAITGRIAAQTTANMYATVDQLAAGFQCQPDELPTRIAALQDELKRLRSDAAKAAAERLTGIVDGMIEKALIVNGTKLICGEIPAVPIDTVRTQVDRIRQKVGSSVIVFGWSDDDKVPLVVALSQDLVKKGHKAGELIKPLAELIGGKGGGKPEMAQAGGKDASKLPTVFAKAIELARSLLAV